MFTRLNIEISRIGDKLVRALQKGTHFQQGAAMSSSDFDPSRKFIRVVEQRADGLVEFEFAVGEPELFVEMLLPRPAFEDFCHAQGTPPQWLAPDPCGKAPHQPALGRSGLQGDSADHAWTWTLHEALHRAPGGGQR